MQDIDTIWRRIKALEGTELSTKSGLPFTYEVSGNLLIPSRTQYNIPKSEVAKALAYVPFDGPGVITNSVRGPAYLWAILHHPDIRKGNW